VRFHYAEGLSSQIYRFFANIRPVRLRNRIAAGGRARERALAMAGRAIVLEENNPTYLDTYAWVLYRLGRYDEAKKTMQQALSLDRSQSPDLQLHYGDILAALGEKFMAEVYWKKALEGGYDDPDAIVERFRRLKEAAQTPAAP